MLIFDTSAFALSWVLCSFRFVVVVLTALGCDAERRVVFVSFVVLCMSQVDRTVTDFELFVTVEVKQPNGYGLYFGYGIADATGR